MPRTSACFSKKLRSVRFCWVASAPADNCVRLVKRPMKPSSDGAKMTLGGDAVASGRDLKAVIAIQMTGISMMNATRMARISRTVIPAFAPGVTWSTRTESTTGELGPVSAKDSLVLVSLAMTMTPSSGSGTRCKRC